MFQWNLLPPSSGLFTDYVDIMFLQNPYTRLQSCVSTLITVLKDSKLGGHICFLIFVYFQIIYYPKYLWAYVRKSDEILLLQSTDCGYLIMLSQL
jgi:hypothetical protein